MEWQKKKKQHKAVSSLGVPLGFSYPAGRNHSYTILFSSTTARKQAELACINYGYHYIHVIMIMSYKILLTYAPRQWH
jgi:hypothetical protein